MSFPGEGPSVACLADSVALCWIADGVLDDFQVFPRLECILQDRHIYFLEEHYHLPLDVAIDSPVDALYSRTPANSMD
ncbi:hypothetical protein N7530_004984 [Penicillium desertorum]|uniref:Uncharacterized protein n=1 Tax=Penicillium desertorum TaxID=1303715 RepID=A0A9W9WZA4_9EURO|nr:hypothetical protein N7530_004984 [Penicillium desertorum]